MFHICVTDRAAGGMQESVIAKEIAKRTENRFTPSIRQLLASRKTVHKNTTLFREEIGSFVKTP